MSEADALSRIKVIKRSRWMRSNLIKAHQLVKLCYTRGTSFEENVKWLGGSITLHRIAWGRFLTQNVSVNIIVDCLIRILFRVVESSIYYAKLSCECERNREYTGSLISNALRRNETSVNP